MKMALEKYVLGWTLKRYSGSGEIRSITQERYNRDILTLDSRDTIMVENHGDSDEVR